MEPVTIDAIAKLISAKFAEFEVYLACKYGLQPVPATVLAVTAVPELVVEEPPAAPTNNVISVPADAEPVPPAVVSPILDEEVKTTHLFSAPSSLPHSVVVLAETFHVFCAVSCKTFTVLACIHLVVGSPITFLPDPEPPPSLFYLFSIF